MPSLSIQMIRASFLNAWVGFAFGTLVVTWKGKPDLLPPEVGGWLLVHVDLLLVGWMLQLAMGVSYWIFPRLPDTRTERGRYKFAYGAAVLLNAGVSCYTIAIILSWGWLQVLGLTLQLAALCAYAYHIAPRVRSTIIK
jgi:hypothetical protein